MAILLFDGMSVLKSAPRIMANAGGGISFAFMRTVRSDIKKMQEYFEEPISAIVCWEGSTDSKKELVEGYKASRSSSPNAFTEARKIVQKILPSCGVTQAVHPDWEADDLLAYFARDSEMTVIRSGDHDLRQTVSDRNYLLQKDMSMKKGTPKRNAKLKGPPEMITPDNFYERCGYKNPQDFMTAKLLLGDKSDELKGMSGIGKTRVETYLYDAACPPKLRQTIDAYLAGDYAKRLRTIMTIPNAQFRDDKIRYTPFVRDSWQALRLLEEAGFAKTVKDFWDWWEPFSKLD